MGSAAESLDVIIYNARDIFNNPGGFYQEDFLWKQQEGEPGVKFRVLVIVFDLKSKFSGDKTKH